MKKSRDALIMQALRRLSIYWPAKKESWKKQELAKGVGLCAACKKAFTREKMHADHIIPCVSLEGKKSWDEVIERMLCEPSGFQWLCINCHHEKTQLENIKRREIKNAIKNGQA